ncbi:MAG TPA: rod shape-determining protein MreD [Streptosporangiaceae bacterium]|nr:rod shape-determining protein MreD [Streptosporangiaceae bacterium]
MSGGLPVKRLIVVVAALAAVLLSQLTIVNGLPLPGGGVPDLVLLCVVAIGLVGGPEPGLIAGFGAGLALDLAPPSTALIGQYALVFCLVGYVSGRFSFTLRSSAVAALAAAAGAAVAGELLVGGLVVVLDTPQVTLATVVRLLPSGVIYDVVLIPVVLFATVRIAVALGVSFSPLDDSPAFETGGSATPMGLARLTRLRQTRHAPAGVGVGGWLTGDSERSVPAVGAVGWLSGPATTRKARREQARLTAALTGAEPRKGAVWVGSRPAGLRPATGSTAPASPSGLGRLRPDAGVAGSAARESLAGAAGQAPSSRSPGVPKIAFGGGGATHPAGPAADPGVPKIAFGTGSLPGSGRASGRGVPKIAFGTGSLPGSARSRPNGRGASKIAFGPRSGGRSGGHQATKDQPSGPGTAKISFGTGGLPGSGRAARRGVPRIRFGRGGLPGGGRTAPRQTPSIAFGSGLPRAPRTSPGRPSLPKFSSGSARSASGPSLPRLSSGSARSASGPWLAGSRLRSAQFGGGAPAGGGRRGRRLKAARWGKKRRYLRWLPFPRRAGGRSAVWRVSRKIGGER